MQLQISDLTKRYGKKTALPNSRLRLRQLHRGRKGRALYTKQQNKLFDKI